MPSSIPLIHIVPAHGEYIVLHIAIILKKDYLCTLNSAYAEKCKQLENYACY